MPKKKKIDEKEKNLLGKKTINKFEERIYFKYEKGIFDEKLINFNDVEQAVKNTKLLIENSIIELKKNKQILDKDIIKVNIHRGSFNFEILIPYFVDLSMQNKELIFEFFKSIIDTLKIKYVTNKEITNLKSISTLKNKNITGSVYNIVINKNYNFSIENKNKKIRLINENEKDTIKENLEILNERERKMEIEKHYGALIQANKNSSNKDIFQPKGTKFQIKIELPKKLSEKAKAKLFSEKEIFIVGETYYCGEEIEKIIVKEVLRADKKALYNKYIKLKEEYGDKVIFVLTDAQYRNRYKTLFGENENIVSRGELLEVIQNTFRINSALKPDL